MHKIKKKGKKMEKVPKKVYVWWEEEEDSDVRYLAVSINVEDSATMGEKKIVGVYELTETLAVSGALMTETISLVTPPAKEQ